MTSTLDLAISMGMFIIFAVLIIVNVLDFFANYRTQTQISQYRSIAYSVYSSLFSSKGIPSNWEDLGGTPVFPGLATDLYRLPISVQDNATARSNTTIGVNITFDSGCAGKAWNNTVALYDLNNNSLTFGIQNANFCSAQFLKNATIVFNDTFSASQTKYYYLYYSPDKNATAASYTLPSAVATNMTIIIYPEEKLTAISVSKLNALRNTSYSNIISLLGNYQFYLTITK